MAIKISSSFNSIEAAFASLQSGDELRIDRSYSVRRTLDVKVRDVSIIGGNNILVPYKNSEPSPILRVINLGEGKDKILWNVHIERLGFKNTLMTGTSGS